MTAAVLDADEQDRFIAHLAGAGIEDGVGRVRPIARRQNRIIDVAVKQFHMQIGSFRFAKHADFLG